MFADERHFSHLHARIAARASLADSVAINTHRTASARIRTDTWSSVDALQQRINAAAEAEEGIGTIDAGLPEPDPTLKGYEGHLFREGDAQSVN